MDTNTLAAILQALAASKAVEVVPVPVPVVHGSNAIQIVTLVLGAIAPVLSALAIYLVRLASERQAAEAAAAAIKLEEVKKDVDGKMSELLAVSKKAAHAEGMTEQRTTSALVEAAHAKGIAQQYQEKDKEKDKEKEAADLGAEVIAAEVEKVAKAIEDTGKVV